MLFGFLLRNSQGHELKPNSKRTHRTFNLLLWNIHSHIRCNSNWIFGRNMLKHRSMECQQSRARQTPAFAWIRRLDGFRMRTINGFDQSLSLFITISVLQIAIFGYTTCLDTAKAKHWQIISPQNILLNLVSDRKKRPYKCSAPWNGGLFLGRKRVVETPHPQIPKCSMYGREREPLACFTANDARVPPSFCEATWGTPFGQRDPSET